MEDKHKDAIQSSFSSLVEQTDLDLMVATLFEKGVFSDAMIEPYKDTSKNTRDRKRLLYRDITRRGPYAFGHLLDALMENGYWDLVRALDPNSSLNPSRPGPSQNFHSLFDNRRKNTGKEQMDPNKNHGSSQDPETQGPPPAGGDRPGEAPINDNGNGAEASGGAGDPKLPRFVVRKSTKFFEDSGSDIKLYRSRSRLRGVLVLFSYVQFENNIEDYRKGALVDRDNLSHLFSEMGFKVLAYTNLSLKDTKKVLEELKNSLCSESPDTVFVIFSSHGYARAGSGDTDIRCSDGHLISYYDVIDYFNNQRFPSLRGVPKVFIFQICRGANSDTLQRLRREPPQHLREPARRPAPRARPGDTTQRDGTTFYYSDDDCSDGDEGPGDKRRYSDIIIANSTVPGYASSRDKLQGSWYIQALCAVFAARAHDCHVADLLTLVDEHLRRRFQTQTSSVDRWGFNRHLYLHPGLYED